MEEKMHRRQDGMSMKQWTLALLTFQNSALILIMHYSRVMPPVGGHRYFASTAVFLNEAIKLAISLSLALNEVSKSLPTSTPATALFAETFSRIFSGDSWKLAVPAMLYTLQNTLQYVAVGNLDAATFQVTYQLKILATAIFSVVMLNRVLSARKWLSLVLLMIGVAIVQIPTAPTNLVPTMKDLRDERGGWHLVRTVEEMRDAGVAAAGQLLSKRSATYEGIEEDFRMQHPQLNASIGLAAAICACLLSGIAGVYFEKVLKQSGSQVSVWVRNVQLSFYSLFPALFIGVMFKDGAEISKFGFLVGYNWVVWTAVAFQALGGVIVSLVVNYADNIAKNFATSISIILSLFASIVFFDMKITTSYFLGTTAVLAATYLYTLPEHERRLAPIVTRFGESAMPGSEPAYLDIETSSGKLEAPRPHGLTSSRPNTPTPETRQSLLLRPFHHIDDSVSLEHPPTKKRGPINVADSSVAKAHTLEIQHNHSMCDTPDGPAKLEKRSLFPRTVHNDYTLSPHFSDAVVSPIVSSQSSAPQYYAGPSLSAPSSREFAEDNARYTPSHSQGGLTQERSRKDDTLSSHLPTKRNPEGPDNKSHSKTKFVQGIQLCSTSELPDRFRYIFPFQYFNAIQSRCFPSVYNSDVNFVLSSPTGSGKTVLFELAICRVLLQGKESDSKIVYMAPTKALCAERTKDWQAKFKDLRVEEVTGDSEATTLRSVQKAAVIVTTPEKWDSMTRNWTDHVKLSRLIRLILLDEIHILGKDRGATLEAVIARMKSIGSDIRMVAVSATVPNVTDIAVWLGRDRNNQDQAANCETFGEDFRPVRLRKYVYGYESSGSDFAFEASLNSKLEEVIRRHSVRRPILVFCFTRASCVNTANHLAELFHSSGPEARGWNEPSKILRAQDSKLNGLPALLPADVAFHHAGLNFTDRTMIEEAFKTGNLSVICCTSTLAVGINLPAHMVIIKGTANFEDGGRLPKELSTLDILQMMGRAGRPQFDNDAVAVIMTQKSKESFYRQKISSQEFVESRLHTNLIEYLNAEIVLGTINDSETAIQWLSGTFLNVRMKSNPEHYSVLLGDDYQLDPSSNLRAICNLGLDLLANHDLVLKAPSIRATGYGAAMARYYVSFESMKIFMGLKLKPDPSAILSAMCMAKEFRDIKFCAREKTHFTKLNKQSTIIRYPIPVNLVQVSHKISLIVQSTMAGHDLLAQEASSKIQFHAEQNMIFQQCRRLIRCIADCQIERNDAVGIRNSLMLVRSLGARIWDSSPMYLQQIPGLGPVGTRKLVGNGVRNIEALLACDPRRLETLCSKNVSTGYKLLQAAEEFPRLKVSMSLSSTSREAHSPAVKITAHIAFLNQDIPHTFNKKDVFVTFLAESEDRKLEFIKIGARQIGHGLCHNFEANLNKKNAIIRCSVACEEIAGTLREAELRVDLQASLFAGTRSTYLQPLAARPSLSLAGNGAKVHSRHDQSKKQALECTNWDDESLDDEDLADLDTGDFQEMEAFCVDMDSDRASNPAKRSNKKVVRASGAGLRPERLPNGNWRCGHKCKNKTSCSHKCCKDGMESKPKQKRPARHTDSEDDVHGLYGDAVKHQWFKAASASASRESTRQSQASSPIRKRTLEHVDLTQDSDKNSQKRSRKPSDDFHPSRASGKVKSVFYTVRHSAPLGADRVPSPGSEFDDLPEFDASDIQPLRVSSRQIDADRLVDGGTGNTSDQDLYAPHEAGPRPAEPCLDEDLYASRMESAGPEGPCVDYDDDILEMALVGAQDSMRLQNDRPIDPGRTGSPSLEALLPSDTGCRRHEPEDCGKGTNGHHIPRAELEAFLLEEFGGCVELA